MNSNNQQESKMTEEKSMPLKNGEHNVILPEPKPQPIPEGDNTLIGIQQWAKSWKPWQRQLFILKIQALAIEVENY